MKLVALKADPMVPWFDSLSLFREIGVFNLGDDGVFVIAEYNGEKPWTNIIDPQSVLDAHEAKTMKFDPVAVVAVGAEFTLSGMYADDGDYIVMVGEFPVSVTVVGGKFSRNITLSQAGVYVTTCKTVPCVQSTITVAM